jgi:hypothetical protein
MKKKKIVLMAGLILVAIILTAEVTLRFTVAGKLQKWSECQFETDPVLGYKYKANSTGIITNAAFSRPYKINSHGFAGNEFTTKKAKGIYRIAVVGCSDETGLYTNGSLNYINITENLLKKEGYKVEMLNLGVDGQSRTIRNIEFSKTICAEYEPDLILYSLTNFPLENYGEYRESYRDIVIRYTDTSRRNLDAAKSYIDNELDHKSMRLYLYDYSYLYRWMVRYYMSRYKKQHSKLWNWFGDLFFVDENKMNCYTRHQIYWPAYREARTVYSTEESMKALNSLQDFLTHRNTQFIVLKLYVYDYLQASDSLFSKYQIHHLFLGVEERPDYWFGVEDGHSSQKGHKAIGQALFKALKDSIPRSFEEK